MNNRCHDPIRKAPRLPGFYQKLLAGNALDKITSFDVVLPEQWNSSQALTGNRALLIAVLADAVQSIHRRKREDIEELEMWLSQTDKDSTAPIPFPWICRMLSLSSNAVRRHLLAAITQARILGLVERRSHHRPWPKERRQPLTRVKMVSHNGKRMSYRRLTDAILQGGV